MEANGLQELLKMAFMSEKLYLETADRIQNADVTRFLNYQSTTRNNLCNLLIERLASKNITPEIRYIDKFKEDLLENSKLVILNTQTTIQEITNCLNYDKQIIAYCYALCAEKGMPTDIKLFLSTEITKLYTSVTKGEGLVSELQQKLETLSINNPYKRTSLN